MEEWCFRKWIRHRSGIETEAGTGRTIPFSRRACAALTLWLSRFLEAGMDTFVYPRHSIGLVGHKRRPHLHGVWLDQPIGQWRKAWKDACAAARIRYRWHDLRHTFITRLAERPEISEQTIIESRRARIALYARAIQPYPQSG